MNKRISTLKTLIIAGDDKGGVTKSASAATVADAIRQFGYTATTVDGDEVNRTLSIIDTNSIAVNARQEAALDQLLPEIAQMSTDIALLDMPGSSGDLLRQYFEPRSLEFFESIGLRILIAMTVVQNEDIVRGLLPWVQAFAKKAEFVIFANNRDTLEGPLDFSALEHGELLLQIAKNRVISIPKFHPLLLLQYNQAKGVPSDYLQGGRRATELKLNALHSQMWKLHLHKVMESIEPYLDWLTGKKPPISPEFLRSGTGPKSPLESWESLEVRFGKAKGS